MDLRDLVASTCDDSNPHNNAPSSITATTTTNTTTTTATTKKIPPTPLSPPSDKSTMHATRPLENASLNPPPPPLDHESSASKDKSLPSPEPSPSTHFFSYNNTTLPQISTLHQHQPTDPPALSRPPHQDMPSLVPPLRSIRKRKSSDLLSVMLDDSSKHGPTYSSIPENTSDSSENEHHHRTVHRVKRRASGNLRQVDRPVEVPPPPLPALPLDIKRESPPSASALPPLPNRPDEPIEPPTAVPTTSPSMMVQVSQPPPPPIALTTPTTISSTSSSSRRHAHILSEQRRRENINGGFQLLKNSVPFCKGTQDSKAMILKKAVDYIISLEQELAQLRYQDPNYHYPMMNSSHPPMPSHPSPHPHHMRPNSSSHQPAPNPHPASGSPYYPMHGQGNPPAYDSNPAPSQSPMLPGGPPPPLPHRTATPPATSQQPAPSYLPAALPYPTNKPGNPTTRHPTSTRASSFSHTFPRSVRSPYYYHMGGGSSNHPGVGNITRPTSTPPLNSYSLHHPERSSGTGEDSALQFGNQILRPQTATIAESTKP